MVDEKLFKQECSALARWRRGCVCLYPSGLTKVFFNLGNEVIVI
jgi:hypothetical protein